MPNRAIVIDEVEPFRTSSMLADMGWQTCNYALDALGTAKDSGPCNLIILYRIGDLTRVVSDVITTDLRRDAPALANIPIVAIGSWKGDDHTALVSGADLHMREDASDAAYERALVHFDVGAPPELGRLVKTFGQAAIVPLIGSLRDMLILALPMLESGDASMAHRIAGSAGILGFAELGRAWSDYEHGSCSSETLARLTRRSIAQLTEAALSL